MPPSLLACPEAAAASRPSAVTLMGRSCCKGKGKRDGPGWRGGRLQDLSGLRLAGAEQPPALTCLQRGSAGSALGSSGARMQNACLFFFLTSLEAPCGQSLFPRQAAPGPPTSTCKSQDVSWLLLSLGSILLLAEARREAPTQLCRAPCLPAPPSPGKREPRARPWPSAAALLLCSCGPAPASPEPPAQHSLRPGPGAGSCGVSAGPASTHGQGQPHARGRRLLYRY